MARKAPGKHHRKGLSIIQLVNRFPDDETARKWMEKERWPDGPECPHCGNRNVQCDVKHPTMTHRCRICPDRPFFSVKTGTVMQSSKLGCRVWAIAIYIVATNLKGTSSMKLHRDLGITQKSAWHLAHRIRKSFEQAHGPFSGPVEMDETYIGGKFKNMSNSKRREMREQGRDNKTAVVGMKDRKTNTVHAEPVAAVHSRAVDELWGENALCEWTRAYTDDSKVYTNVINRESVNHSALEFVRGEVHTNGIESFWSMLKRGYVGTYHKMSPKQLERYVTEFAGRHNIRNLDTLDQMAVILWGLDKKRLRYRDLIADNGLDSGARSA